jgi:transcription antitermination factor NusG
MPSAEVNQSICMPHFQQDHWTPDAYLEPHWYALCTSSNHEKVVAEQLRQRGVDYFLPLYNSLRRWKDRRVQLQFPLFAGYVFVHIALRDRLRVLEIPSAARLVGFGGPPLALPEQDIEAIRTSLTREVRAEPHPFVTTGKRVRVVAGPLTGLEGVVIRKRNGLRFVISLDLIMRSVAVEMNASDLAPLAGSRN